MNNEQKKMLAELDRIATDRYERQLLKYFDFVGWIRSVLEGKPGKAGALRSGAGTSVQ